MAKDIWYKLTLSKEKKVFFLLGYSSLMIPDNRKHIVNMVFWVAWWTISHNVSPVLLFLFWSVIIAKRSTFSCWLTNSLQCINSN